jgi:hypothetical protein
MRRVKPFHTALSSFNSSIAVPFHRWLASELHEEILQATQSDTSQNSLPLDDMISMEKPELSSPPLSPIRVAATPPTLAVPVRYIEVDDPSVSTLESMVASQPIHPSSAPPLPSSAPIPPATNELSHPGPAPSGNGHLDDPESPVDVTGASTLQAAPGAVDDTSLLTTTPNVSLPPSSSTTAVHASSPASGHESCTRNCSGTSAIGVWCNSWWCHTVHFS